MNLYGSCWKNPVLRLEDWFYYKFIFLKHFDKVKFLGGQTEIRSEFKHQVENPVIRLENDLNVKGF